MPGRRFRMYSREFKEAAVRRVLSGEKIRAVARELRLGQLLYTWLDQYEQGGADALEVLTLVVEIGRGDKGDASSSREERGERRAAARTQRSARMKEDAAGGHASSRRSCAIERTM